MNIVRYLLLCTFISHSCLVYAQDGNYIPNGSFEIINKDSIRNTFFQAAYPWQGPAVPLIINNKYQNDQPQTIKTSAIEGSNMIEIVVPPNECSHIVSVKLLNKLEKSEKYKLSFYYYPNQKFNKRIIINMCFAEHMDPDGNTPFLHNDTLFCSDFVPSGKKQWNYAEIIFEANGLENYFVFYSDLKLNQYKRSRYLFDDFKLVHLNPTKTVN